MKCGIYKITNNINHRFYIGSTNNIHVRKLQHWRFLKNNKHDNKFLQNDVNKLGIDNFYFDVIEEYNFYSQKFIENREQYFINKFFDYQKKCYNICNIVKTPPKAFGNKWSSGKKASEETKLKQSLSHKGKIFTEIHKKRISKSLSGKKRPDSVKLKISIAHSNKILTKEHKNKISLTSYRKTKIICFNLESRIEKEFDSLNEAAAFYNITRYIISDILRGRYITHKNLTFKYKN